CPQKVIANCFRKGAVPDLSIEDFLELGVASRDSVADDYEVEIRGDVVGAVALQRDDALLNQEVAHRRIDVLVGSAYIVATPLQKRGQRGHRGPAHTNEMDSPDAHALTAASSMMSEGRGAVRTRARTPNGNVNVGPAV